MICTFVQNKTLRDHLAFFYHGFYNKNSPVLNEFCSHFLSKLSKDHSLSLLQLCHKRKTYLEMETTCELVNKHAVDMVCISSNYCLSISISALIIEDLLSLAAEYHCSVLQFAYTLPSFLGSFINEIPV